MFKSIGLEFWIYFWIKTEQWNEKCLVKTTNEECKQTELILIRRFCITTRWRNKDSEKKKIKKKNTTLPIVGLFGFHKGEQKSYQQGQMFKSGLHSYRNYTWKYVIKGHISSVLLIITFCCAQALSCENPWVSNYRSNYNIPGHR